MKLEYRDLKGLEIRASDTSKRLAGYASVFNSEIDIRFWDGSVAFSERIAPEAFDRTLREEGDVRALVDHDSGKVIARTKAKTLSLSVDSRGLFAEIDVADTTTGRDILESVRRGDIDGMSFGFSVRSDKWEKRENGPQLRTILDVELFEVSVVAFPAYPETSISARSALQIFEERMSGEKREENLYEVELWQKKLGLYRLFG